SLEDVAVVSGLAAQPRPEVQYELAEGPLEEEPVSLPRRRLFQLVNEPGGPRVHRRVDVAEVPLVSRQLPVRVQVAVVKQQLKLLLGERDVDGGEGHRMESEVPR